MTDTNISANKAQKILLERYRHPRHRGVTNPIDLQECGHNPYCGDTVKLTLALAERDRIEDIKFEGHGCVLCLASAELLASVVKGKSVLEALSYPQQVRQAIVEQRTFPPYLNALEVLRGVSQYPTRVKCVTLAWHTLKAALEKVAKS